ncbi:MAG TPA: sulfotransferase [Nitrososphaeraceae archaeon]|nr:sulfotransferase [Nitrososphaeraceae archaeon]
MAFHASTPTPMKPILIIGAPGSGTTLLYQTLCSHRDLAYVTPNMLRAGILRHGRLLGDRRKALFILQNLIHRDQTSNLPQGDAIWVKYFGDYSYMTENNYSEEIAAYYRKKLLAVQNLWGRSRFVDKTLLNCFRVRLLNSIFPDVKFIHIIRDGRAVAFSILKKIEIAGDPNPLFHVGFKEILGDKYQSQRSQLYNYGLAWAEFVRRGREASAFGQSRYYEIYYEDLVTDPYNELRNIVDFCELNWYSEFEEKIPHTQNMNKKWKQKTSKEQHIDVEESTFDLRRSLGIAE